PVEQPAHDARAAGVGQELAVVPDQAAGRHMESEPRLAAARGPHVAEFAAALSDLLDDDAGELLVDVDLHLLDRLQPLAAGRIALEAPPRPAAREFVAPAPHRLHQHRQLQLAAAGDLEGVLALGFAHADGDVALGLAQQPRADHAARHLVAFLAGERR